jgi:hypothetical protein
MNFLINELAVQPYHRLLIFLKHMLKHRMIFFIPMKIRIQHNNYDFNLSPNVEIDFMKT